MLQQLLNDSLDDKSYQSFQQQQVSIERKSQADCQYCIMKKKFNLGKCFQHSFPKTDIQTTIDIPHPQNQDIISINDMVQALQEVQEGLNYYWDHLREVSKGNPNEFKKQLQPIQIQFKKVQQKMKKFFFQPFQDTFQIQRFSHIKSNKKKYQCAGSQKFNRFELQDIFDTQQQSFTDSIKQWVSHFYKILHTRNISVDESQQLPFQKDLQMRIFKQSMQRKFLSFSQQYEKSDKKIHQLLQKLIFYMQKSQGIVPLEKINQDITFLQMQQIQKQNSNQTYQRMLFLQATAIQHLLDSYT